MNLRKAGGADTLDNDRQSAASMITTQVFGGTSGGCVICTASHAS
jgi:hypothetical protein